MRLTRLRLLLLAIVVATPLLLAGLVLWMADGVQLPRVVDAPLLELDNVAQTGASADPQALRILVWNIAWGYGQGSEGTGSKKARSHFTRTLEQIANAVRSSGADIVMLQEIDFDATRSYHQDQAQAIAAAAGLPYVAPAVSWHANWVPFPYWPPADQFGRMRSGGAILSRYPLTDHQVKLLPKPEANAFHYNLFYLFRYAQEARVDTPLGALQLINVHLEAFDAINRMRQANMIAERWDGKLAPLTVLAGDLNSVPPEAPVRAGFVDEPHADFTEDETLGVLRSIGLRDAVAARDYRTDPTTRYTFPASAPSRTLDHALLGSGLAVSEVRVYAEAGEISDHLPLLVTLTLADT